MLKHMSPEQFVHDKAIAEARGSELKQEKVATQTGLATADLEVMTVSDQLEALKKEAKGLVNRLGMTIARKELWADDDARRQNIYMNINKRWIRLGGRKAENTTIGDMTSKIDWLKNQLIKLTEDKIDEDLLNG
jgi:hypothetical protein